MRFLWQAQRRTGSGHNFLVPIPKKFVATTFVFAMRKSGFLDKPRVSVKV
jgi:hypothetical protein